MIRPSPARPSSSARSTPRRRPTRWPPRKAGRSGRTAPPGGGWCRHPSPGRSWRSRRSPGCSSGEPWSSARAAAASPRCTRPRRPAHLVGVEAVIDKDLASELLAEDVAADLFVMATDVDGVYVGLGHARSSGGWTRCTPEELAGYEFAAGSMGPKVEAATRFATKTGRRAAIGSLADITGIVAGQAGTNVVAQRAPAGVIVDDGRIRRQVQIGSRNDGEPRSRRPRRPRRRRREEVPVGAPGRVHRCRGDGGGGDLRAAGRGRRGGRGGGVAVVPDRRGRRGTAGVLVREAGRPVPVGRGAAGVRGEIDRQRPFHRGHRVADLYGQRHRDGDGGGVVRELRHLDVRRGERRRGSRCSRR